MTLVADDVVHVRLARGEREQEARRELVPLLGLPHERYPAAGTGLANLLGQLIRADVHGSSDLTASSRSHDEGVSVKACIGVREISAVEP
jgi:hypothetical protein